MYISAMLNLKHMHCYKLRLFLLASFCFKRLLHRYTACYTQHVFCFFSKFVELCHKLYHNFPVLFQLDAILSSLICMCMFQEILVSCAIVFDYHHLQGITWKSLLSAVGFCEPSLTVLLSQCVQWHRSVVIAHKTVRKDFFDVQIPWRGYSE